MKPARRGFLLGGAVMAALFLGPGCAPRVVSPPELGPLELRQRFERNWVQRAQRARSVEAPLSVWSSLPSLGKLPGLDALVWMGAPDSCALLVNGFFGPLLKAWVLGDSLTVWWPDRKAALRADAARDSMGLERPGSWVSAALAAMWSPPDEAWRSAQREDSLLVVAWKDETGRRRRLGVGSDGLPRRFEFEVASGRRALARYPEWRVVEGVAWPMRIELEDDPKSWSATLRVGRLRFPGPAERRSLAARVPPGAELWSWERLRRALMRSPLGGG